MGFRFRRRTRLFPGVNLNWSKNGLSSISLGGPGASINVPVAREGSTRSTVGLPGTGLSYSHQESVGQRRQRQRQATQLPIPSTEVTLPSTEGEFSLAVCIEGFAALELQGYSHSASCVNVLLPSYVHWASVEHGPHCTRAEITMTERLRGEE